MAQEGPCRSPTASLAVGSHCGAPVNSKPRAFSATFCSQVRVQGLALMTKHSLCFAACSFSFSALGSSKGVCSLLPCHPGTLVAVFVSSASVLQAEEKMERSQKCSHLMLILDIWTSRKINCFFCVRYIRAVCFWDGILKAFW